MHRTIKTTGLNCPNCAGKIEQAINQLAWIQTASVNIATQEITLQTSETPTQDQLKEIQQIVLSYEPDVTVYIESQSQDSLESLEPQQKDKLIQIISASLLLVIGVFLLYKAPGFSRLTFILLLMAYLIAGLDVITAALKNITRGVWFDEHFLMAVATLGAFAEQHSNHPIAESIRQAYHQEVTSVSLDQIEEVAGKGLRVQYQGHSLFVGNATLLEEAGVSFNPCNDSGTKVYVAYKGQSLGVIVIDDALKPDSITAIDQLRTLGIDQCIMLTGDNEQTAQSTAKTLELDRYYAQLLPEDKVLLMEQIAKDLPIDHKVAFVGDGINDAPVLARADLGVAMGALGSDAAIEAADIVLMTDEPSKLAQAIQISQKTKRIAYQNILFALGVKLLFLILGALGLTSMWLAVFADVGVALIAVFNARRMIR